MLFHLYGAIFQCYTEKCPEDVDDKDVTVDLHHRILSEVLRV